MKSIEIRKRFMITPQQFVSQFRKTYAEIQLPPCCDWTEFMVGSGESRKHGDFGIFGRVARAFNVEVSAEELRVDQTWWVYYDITTATRLSSNENEYSTPYRYLVAIEDENDCTRTFRTLRKLMALNIPLKVYITYPWRTEGRGRTHTRQYYLRQAMQVLRDEAEDTTRNNYLVIFGPEEDNVTAENISLNEWSFHLYNPRKQKFQDL